MGAGRRDYGLCFLSPSCAAREHSRSPGRKLITPQGGMNKTAGSPTTCIISQASPRSSCGWAILSPPHPHHPPRGRLANVPLHVDLNWAKRDAQSVAPSHTATSTHSEGFAGPVGEGPDNSTEGSAWPGNSLLGSQAACQWCQVSASLPGASGPPLAGYSLGLSQRAHAMSRREVKGIEI